MSCSPATPWTSGALNQQKLKNACLLIAEMKLLWSGALSEFQIKQTGEKKTEIVQIARFLPSGLLGLAYWFAVSPFHEFIFTGMLSGVAKGSPVQDHRQNR